MSLQEDAKRILPFVQAMADGKTVQVQVGDKYWIDKESATFDSAWILRIKPEKKLRPYTREEFIEKGLLGKPFLNKRNRDVVIATLVSSESFYTAEYDARGVPQRNYSFEEALETLTHLDGKPLGVEVTDITGIGPAKATQIEDALVEFWAQRNSTPEDEGEEDAEDDAGEDEGNEE